MTVAFSDSHPTLYVVHGRAEPVIFGPNSTEANLCHHGETAYRVGCLSENATDMLKKKDVCEESLHGPLHFLNPFDIVVIQIEQFAQKLPSERISGHKIGVKSAT